MKIGEKIKLLRKKKSMTLAQLSKRSGVALASLCRMEKGRMTGTLESHTNIARALGVRLTDLLQEVESEKSLVDVVKQKQKAEVFEYNKSASYAILTTDSLSKNMMPLVLELKPGGSTHVEESRVGTEKFFYVLDGKAEIAVKDKKYQLKKGETIYLDASVPHKVKNISGEKASLICVVSPPAL